MSPDEQYLKLDNENRTTPPYRELIPDDASNVRAFRKSRKCRNNLEESLDSQKLLNFFALNHNNNFLSFFASLST
jgi:hypothetical protein